MFDQLFLHTRVHLKFFARNWLVQAFAVLVLAASGVSLAPALLAVTTIGRFELLGTITTQLGATTLWLTSGLGLFTVSTHLRSRALKLVLTKPCPPELWLGSVFLAGIVVIAALHLLMAGLIAFLSASWGVPYQDGFAFVAIDGFFRSLIWFSYATALGMLLHPVLAVLVAVFVNERVFYGLKVLIASAVKAQGPGWTLSVAGRLVDAAYFVLPMTAPFQERTQDLYSSFRTVAEDWSLLFPIGGYAALASAFFFCAADLVLRRRNLT